MVLCITGGSGFDNSMGLMWAMVSTVFGRLGALVDGVAGFWWRADGAVGVRAGDWVKGLSCGGALLFFGGRGFGCCCDRRAARSCCLGVGGGSFLLGGDFRESILLWAGDGQSSGSGGVRGIIIILARAAPA